MPRGDASASARYDPAFDAAGPPAASPPRFRILAPDAAAAEMLKPMLSRQVWPHWSLGLADERREIGDDDYVLPLRAGDRLEPYALAVLAAHAERDDRPDALYADEDALPRPRAAPPRA